MVLGTYCPQNATKVHATVPEHLAWCQGTCAPSENDAMPQQLGILEYRSSNMMTSYNADKQAGMLECWNVGMLECWRNANARKLTCMWEDCCNAKTPFTLECWHADETTKLLSTGILKEYWHDAGMIERWNTILLECWTLERWDADMLEWWRAGRWGLDGTTEMLTC